MIRQFSKNGVLDHDLHIAVANIDHPLYDAVETTAKGPEHPLPKGAGFYDKDGVRREYIRVKWWADNPATWQEIAMSVPKPEQLPAGRPEHGILERSYSPDAPPVFFGHYWLTGAPCLQAPNALCLDYSAGKGKEPLVSYLHEPGENSLEINRMSGHPELQN